MEPSATSGGRSVDRYSSLADSSHGVVVVVVLFHCVYRIQADFPQLSKFIPPILDFIVSHEGWSRDSDWLRAGRPRGRSSCPGRCKIFLLSTLSRSILWPTQPPIQCVPEALSPGVKQPRREADHSPSSSAEVKNTWIYTHTPPHVFMA
jgi:hypothetical protein